MALYVDLPLNRESLQKQMPYSRWRMAALEGWNMSLKSILRNRSQVKVKHFQNYSRGNTI
jgi:hypothetical protein